MQNFQVADAENLPDAGRGRAGYNPAKMNAKLRNFLLKSIPYLLSIAGGLIIFIVSSDEIHNANLNDLINNISASLLSIPLVFLLYDYSNYLIARRVNKTLAASMTGRVGSIIAGLQQALQNVAGVRKTIAWDEFESRLVSRRVSFRHPRITAQTLARLTTARDQLDDIVYRIASTGALSRGQIQILADMVRDLSRIIDQNKFHGASGSYAQFLENVVVLIGEWFDSTAAATDAPAISAVGNMASTDT